MADFNETFVIDTPEGIAMYRLLACQKALKLEVEHGIRFGRGRNPLHTARSILGENVKTKKQALAMLTEIIDEIMPQEEEDE